MTDPAAATEELRHALAVLGIRETHQIDVRGISILSICADLVVWCSDEEFHWTEDWKTRVCLAEDVAGAAVRLARRYERLRRLA